MKKVNDNREACKPKQLDKLAIHQKLNRIMKAAEEINREVDEILAMAHRRPVT